ncbi:unnamed protein product [Aphanomyces euteiches]
MPPDTTATPTTASPPDTTAPSTSSPVDTTTMPTTTTPTTTTHTTTTPPDVTTLAPLTNTSNVSITPSPVDDYTDNNQTTPSTTTPSPTDNTITMPPDTTFVFRNESELPRSNVFVWASHGGSRINGTWVQVCKESLYLIPISRGLGCVGVGLFPLGTECPRRGDSAASNCSGIYCVASEDGRCQQVKANTWGCVFPSLGCVYPSRQTPI